MSDSEDLVFIKEQITVKYKKPEFIDLTNDEDDEQESIDVVGGGLSTEEEYIDVVGGLSTEAEVSHISETLEEPPSPLSLSSVTTDNSSYSKYLFK